MADGATLTQRLTSAALTPPMPYQPMAEHGPFSGIDDFVEVRHLQITNTTWPHQAGNVIQSRSWVGEMLKEVKGQNDIEVTDLSGEDRV